MLKKLLLFLLFATPMMMFAQDKIAHLNVNEIFSKMPESKAAQTKLESKGKVLETQATAIEKEFNDYLEKIQKDTTEVTAAISADRQAMVQQYQERYKRFMETSQAELEEERKKLFAPIEEKLRKAIKEVGDENNLTYIFDSSVLLHVSSSAVDAGKYIKTKLGIKD